MITGKRNPYKLLKINDKVYSKSSELDKEILKKYLEKCKEIEIDKAASKRLSYNFVCKACGKEYSRLLNVSIAEKCSEIDHYCAECTKSGVMFLNKPKSKQQKIKMSNSALGRKWVNNGVEARQLHEPDLSKYISNGWKLGQLKKINKES